jgi:ABC-type branched-subunit amino acid transport system substrate-binding protein
LDVVFTSQYFTLSGLLLGPYSSKCTQGMRSVSLLKVNATGALSAVPDVTFSWSSCLSSDGTIISPIVFGQSAPLEGTVRELGIGMRQGILSSFAARNRLGGIRNRKLVLISRDDGYEPASSLANAKYLINEQNVFALVGPVGTPTTQAMLPVIEEQNTPLVGMSKATIFRIFFFN